MNFKLKMNFDEFMQKIEEFKVKKPQHFLYLESDRTFDDSAILKAELEYGIRFSESCKLLLSNIGCGNSFPFSRNLFA